MSERTLAEFLEVLGHLANILGLFDILTFACQSQIQGN